MPHYPSDMAEYHRGNTKIFVKSRKPPAVRKGSPRQLKNNRTQCCSSPGRASPHSSLTHKCVLPVITDLEGFGFNSSAAYLRDVTGLSDPAVGTVKSTLGSQMAPAPASLPKPPVQWTAVNDNKEVNVILSDIFGHVGQDVTNQIKMLLKVQG